MEQENQIPEKNQFEFWVLKKLIYLQARNDALQRLFVNYLLANFPSHQKKQINDAFLKYYQEALEHTKDIAVAYSPEMSAKIYSELKDIDGIELSGL